MDVFFADDIKGSVNGDNVEMKAVSVSIAIDNKDIFSINGFRIANLLDSEEVRTERRNNEHFILPWNKTW
jgi:hypothetical protein